MPRLSEQKLLQELSPNKMAVAEALAEGASNREAARRCGVTERTVYNYRQDPTVQRYIWNLQNNKTDEAAGATSTLLPQIIETLKEIVTGTRVNEEGEEFVVLASNFDKIQAARVLISANSEYQYRLSLERKIADLETRLFKLLTKEAKELEAIQAEDALEELQAKQLEEEELRLEAEAERANETDHIAHTVLDVDSTTILDSPEDDSERKPTMQELSAVLAELDVVVEPKKDFLDHI